MAFVISLTSTFALMIARWATCQLPDFAYQTYIQADHGYDKHLAETFGELVLSHNVDPSSALSTPINAIKLLYQTDAYKNHQKRKKAEVAFLEALSKQISGVSKTVASAAKAIMETIVNVKGG